MTDISVNELREWYLAFKNNSKAEDWPNNIIIALIVAYRDMAIKAGEWPCTCGHVIHVSPPLITECSEIVGIGSGTWCPCMKYVPVEL